VSEALEDTILPLLPSPFENLRELRENLRERDLRKRL